jgi:hypothetical protein
MILLIILLFLRILYGFGEGTTEGFTWRWVNQNEKEPKRYHFWREIVENMGRRLELALLFYIVFSWIGLVYWMLIEVIALVVYELRLRQIIYDDWRYEKQSKYEIDIGKIKIKLPYPNSGMMIFIAGICILVLIGIICQI